MTLTGMADHNRVLPLAEQAMALFREGNVDQAHRVGEEFWSQVPQPPVTDGDLLSAQLSLMIAERAAAVAPPLARLWLQRGRTAYGEQSTGGVAKCDFVEGMINVAEGNIEEARALFGKSVDAMGPKVFDGRDPQYREIFAGESPAHSGADFAQLAEQGDALMEEGDLTGAIGIWRAALDRVAPSDSENLVWFNTSIGDAQFELGEYDDAWTSLQSALKAGGNDNPFVWLRLGQVAFELGNSKQASDALMSAYMLAGDEIFDDEDPKYRQWLVDQGLIR